MTEETQAPPVKKAAAGDIVVCTGECRVYGDIKEGEATLQQKWAIHSPRGGPVVYEWRDVPTVPKEEPAQPAKALGRSHRRHEE